MSRRAESVTRKVINSIEDAVEGSYQKIVDMVEPALQAYQRQVDTYKRKAQVIDIASRYLKNGTTKVSAADRKKVGKSYSKKLDEIVAFNKKYKKAKDSAKEVAGLKRRNSALEREKSSLQTRLDRQKTTYEGRIERLEKKYKEAKFVKKRLEEVRAMPLSTYEKAMKTEDSLKQFEESTYYEGKPTAVTGAVQDVIAIIKARDSINETCKEYVDKLRAIIDDPNGDNGGDSGPGNGGSPKPKKNTKKKKKR